MDIQGLQKISVRDAHINALKEEIKGLNLYRQKIDKENERLRDLLENVVNVLDLSESAIYKHGPLGTEPAELVRLVLQEKDKRISYLQRGMLEIKTK